MNQLKKHLARTPRKDLKDVNSSDLETRKAGLVRLQEDFRLHEESVCSAWLDLGVLEVFCKLLEDPNHKMKVLDCLFHLSFVDGLEPRLVKEAALMKQLCAILAESPSAPVGAQALTIISNISCCPETRLPLVQDFEILKLVLPLFQRDDALSQDTQHKLLQLVSSLCSQAECKPFAFREPGLVSFLFTLIKDPSARVASTATLHILYMLSSYNDKKLELVEEHKVLELSTLILNDDERTSDAKLVTIGILANISFSVACRPFFGQTDGLVDALVELCSDEEHPSIQHNTLLTFKSLASCTEMANFFIKHEGVIPIIRKLAGGTGPVQEIGLSFFYSLANSPGIPAVLVEDDELLQIAVDALESPDNAVVSAVTGFFWNCSFVELTHKKLKEIGLVEKLEPLLKKNKEVEFDATVILVQLIGTEEKDNIITASSHILDMFITGLVEFLDTGHYLGATYETKEFLIPIKLLCVSEKNKPGFCKSAVFVNALLRVMREGMETSPEDVGLAVEILLQISFYYDDTSLGNVERHVDGSLMDLFEEGASKELRQLLEKMLVDSENSPFDREAQQRAQTVLWTLWPELKPEVRETESKHVMLSYSWSVNKSLVEEFGQKLRELGRDVWRDEEGSNVLHGMTGSIDDTMAAAVEKASAVIIFVSKAYKESSNCQAEARYANKLSKQGRLTLHFVMVEEGYDPDGFLGIMMGDQLWHQAFSVDDIPEAIARLDQAIERSGTCLKVNLAAGQHSRPGASSTPLKSTSSKKQLPDAVEWSTEEVGRWLKSDEKLAKYASSFEQHEMDGMSMRMLSTSPCSSTEMEGWMNKFGVEKIGEMLRIIGKAQITFG